MGLLLRLLGSEPAVHAASPNPADDFWYTDRGQLSFAGVSVTPETSLSISTVFRCVSAIAQDIAGMPLIMYRRLERGKERAPNHPLYTVLHDRPNEWQTSFEWREMMMGHLLLRGNAFNLLQAGPRGFADQLIPLNPARMKVEQLSNQRLRYTYSLENGREAVYTQDEILHLRGLSSDGIVGLSVVGLARESFGLGIATEQYGARYFNQSSVPVGVLQVDGTLSPEAFDRLKKGWDDAHGGLPGSHKVAILERGTKWQQVGLSNEDSQFLATRNLQIEEIARWFGVPLHRIGHTSGVTSWGTGIAQFSLGYVIFTLIPWVKRIEQAISRDLILAPQTYFAEFLLDHLLRGDITARYQAYGMGIKDGWLTRNEARERENLNPAEGLDDYLVPQNMATVDEAGNIRPLNEGDKPLMPERTGKPPPEGISGNSVLPAVDQRAQLLAHEAAARIIRKEQAAIGKAAKRFSGDALEFQAWLGGFYDEHADFVVQALHLAPAAARAYADRQRDDVLANGVKAIEAWEANRTLELAALALGETHPAIEEGDHAFTHT